MQCFLGVREVRKGPASHNKDSEGGRGSEAPAASKVRLFLPRVRACTSEQTRDARCTTIFARVARPLHTERRRPPLGTGENVSLPRGFLTSRGRRATEKDGGGQGMPRPRPRRRARGAYPCSPVRAADAAAAGRRVSSRRATGPGAPPLERTILRGAARTWPSPAPPFTMPALQRRTQHIANHPARNTSLHARWMCRYVRSAGSLTSRCIVLYAPRSRVVGELTFGSSQRRRIPRYPISIRRCTILFNARRSDDNYCHAI